MERKPREQNKEIRNDLRRENSQCPNSLRFVKTDTKCLNPYMSRDKRIKEGETYLIQSFSLLILLWWLQFQKWPKRNNSALFLSGVLSKGGKRRRRENRLGMRGRSGGTGDLREVY